MEIATPFVVTVNKVDGSKFVPFGSDLFSKVKFQGGDDGSYDFKTSLVRYLGGSAKTTAIPESEELNEFKQFLLDSANEYLGALGYDSSKNVLSVTSIWLNDMGSGTFHSEHRHVGSTISGCFYVDVPEGSGLIVIKNPLDMRREDLVKRELTPATALNVTLGVRKGDILMWESDIEHSVPTLTFEGRRRCIAFDIKLIDTKE